MAKQLLYLITALLLLLKPTRGYCDPHGRQISFGYCSPNIANVAGNININCTEGINSEEITKAIDKAIKNDANSKKEFNARTLAPTIRTIIVNELLRLIGDGYLDQTVGHFTTEILQPPNETELNPKQEKLIDEIESGIYVGPLFKDWDSSVLTLEAQKVLNIFARHLVKAQPKLVTVATHLAKACPATIIKQCHEKYRHANSEAYAQKLSERRSNAIKTFLDNVIKANNCNCTIEMITEGFGQMNPIRPYPTTRVPTVKDWEAAAAANFRVVIGVSF